MSVTHDLQSGETDTILNTIDGLRSNGIGNILELPQIIVCGDQSSGKSSVLNAVSTLKFPTKDGLCTRFATEVIMRPGSPQHIMVSIVPGPGRSQDEKRNLESFRPSSVSMDDIEDLIARATVIMGISPEDPRARRFSDDILRFEVTGPNQPSLTLVDLPGLFQAPNKYQTEEDTNSVRDLVLRYMRNKRSVILAVISAKSEFVLQSVTKFSREVDEHGTRTLGIITKPDKLDVGSESEKKFLELIDNNQVYLQRGWHVLVNRDHNTRNYSQDERDNAEKQFLSSGVWARLPSNHKGVFTLRSRLSSILREQILEELPALVREAGEEISRCKTRLSKLGVSRATAEDRRRYLLHAAQTFNIMLRACINGSYDDRFFNIEEKGLNKEKRLRAVIQNTLMQYSDDMHKFGHAKHVVDDWSNQTKDPHPHEVTQTEFEDVVIDLMKHSRGRELMGTYNPMIIRELFLTQSEPWVHITKDYQSKIWEAVKKSIDLVLHHATDENTKEQLKRRVIQPALARILVALDDMIDKLLKPRLLSHPITYNRGFAESIQKAKQASAEKIFADAYGHFINGRTEVVSKETLEYLFRDQAVIRPAHLTRFAASEAIDVMRAYYKIAKESLVDNFSTLAIEDCLVSQIPDILSPEVVAELDDDAISEIAMETESASWERSETERRLELCTSALKKLRNIEDMRAPGKSSFAESKTQLGLTCREGPRFADGPDPVPFFKSEVIDGMKTSEKQDGTELSKQDQGFSDEEDKQTSASDRATELLNVPVPQATRKKKVSRDSWHAP